MGAGTVGTQPRNRLLRCSCSQLCPCQMSPGATWPHITLSHPPKPSPIGDPFLRTATSPVFSSSQPLHSPCLYPGRSPHVLCFLPKYISLENLQASFCCWSHMLAAGGNASCLQQGKRNKMLGSFLQLPGHQQKPQPWDETTRRSHKCSHKWGSKSSQQGWGCRVPLTCWGLASVCNAGTLGSRTNRSRVEEVIHWRWD